MTRETTNISSDGGCGSVADGGKCFKLTDRSGVFLEFGCLFEEFYSAMVWFVRTMGNVHLAWIDRFLYRNWSEFWEKCGPFRFSVTWPVLRSFSFPLSQSFNSRLGKTRKNEIIWSVLAWISFTHVRGTAVIAVTRCRFVLIITGRFSILQCKKRAEQKILYLKSRLHTYINDRQKARKYGFTLLRWVCWLRNHFQYAFWCSNWEEWGRSDVDTVDNGSILDTLLDTQFIRSASRTESGREAD